MRIPGSMYQACGINLAGRGIVSLRSSQPEDFPPTSLVRHIRRRDPNCSSVVPESLKVGRPEAACPSMVSDMFAAAGASFETPLFLTPLSPSPIKVTFDVKFAPFPTWTVIAVVGPVAPKPPAVMKAAVTTSVIEDFVSFRDGSGQRQQSRKT
ncbi:hypothetical protein VTK56DRAFT_5226 [Thermocarpiscus australiensis]